MSKRLTFSRNGAWGIAGVDLSTLPPGARKIMVDYDGNGQPEGVTFGIETPDGPRGVALPANVDGALALGAGEVTAALRRITEDDKAREEGPTIATVPVVRCG